MVNCCFTPCSILQQHHQGLCNISDQAESFVYEGVGWSLVCIWIGIGSGRLYGWLVERVRSFLVLVIIGH